MIPSSKNTFEPVEDASVILISRGVYRKVSLYTFDDLLYARVGAGFIKLKPNGLTSASLYKWTITHGVHFEETYNGLRTIPLITEAQPKPTKLKVAN